MAGLAAEEAKAWPWPWDNPQIVDTGRHISGAYYDPFAGRVVIHTERQRVRESVLDPHRNHIDPGSRHWVNRLKTDAQGRTWRVSGWRWTSHGVPHGNLKRTRISGTGIPGVDHHETDRVAYSYHPGNNHRSGTRRVPAPQQPEPRQFINHNRMNRNRINNLFD